MAQSNQKSLRVRYDHKRNRMIAVNPATSEGKSPVTTNPPQPPTGSTLKNDQAANNMILTTPLTPNKNATCTTSKTTKPPSKPTVVAYDPKSNKMVVVNLSAPRPTTPKNIAPPAPRPLPQPPRQHSKPRPRRHYNLATSNMIGLTRSPPDVSLIKANCRVLSLRPTPERPFNLAKHIIVPKHRKELFKKSVPPEVKLIYQFSKLLISPKPQSPNSTTDLSTPTVDGHLYDSASPILSEHSIGKQHENGEDKTQNQNGFTKDAHIHSTAPIKSDLQAQPQNNIITQPSPPTKRRRLSDTSADEHERESKRQHLSTLESTPKAYAQSLHLSGATPSAPQPNSLSRLISVRKQAEELRSRRVYGPPLTTEEMKQLKDNLETENRLTAKGREELGKYIGEEGNVKYAMRYLMLCNVFEEGPRKAWLGRRFWEFKGRAADEGEWFVSDASVAGK